MHACASLGLSHNVVHTQRRLPRYVSALPALLTRSVKKQQMMCSSLANQHSRLSELVSCLAAPSWLPTCVPMQCCYAKHCYIHRSCVHTPFGSHCVLFGLVCKHCKYAHAFGFAVRAYWTSNKRQACWKGRVSAFQASPCGQLRAAWQAV